MRHAWNEIEIHSILIDLRAKQNNRESSIDEDRKKKVNQASTSLQQVTNICVTAHHLQRPHRTHNTRTYNKTDSINSVKNSLIWGDIA